MIRESNRGGDVTENSVDVSDKNICTTVCLQSQ